MIYSYYFIYSIFNYSLMLAQLNNTSDKVITITPRVRFFYITLITWILDNWEYMVLFFGAENWPYKGAISSFDFEYFRPYSFFHAKIDI